MILLYQVAFQNLFRFVPTLTMHDIMRLTVGLGVFKGSNDTNDYRVDWSPWESGFTAGVMLTAVFTSS
jgi:hypothetical protein